MTQNNSVILSSNQIHRLHHTFFVPAGEIRATLLIVHGMSEHSGRYSDFARVLADNGVLVATYDQLGHGLTVNDKYELGFFDERHPVQTLCKDVMLVADALKQKAAALNAPNVPHVVMGHSMGSFVVRTVLAHHATSFDAVILMGTGNNHNLLTQAAGLYLYALNRLQPKRRNDKLARALNHYLMSKIRHPRSPSPFAWLANNIAAVKAFEADPLCGFAFSNNGFLTLQALIKKSTQPSWYAHLAKGFPVLLISGKDDPVGNMGRDVSELSQTLLRQDIHVKSQLYPNMRHEILHETDAQRVYDDVLAWLNGLSV